MKRFSFRLQALLNYKGYLERLAQQETAKVRKDIDACDQQIASLKQQLAAAGKQMDNKMRKGICAREFRQHQDFLAAMQTGVEEEKNRKHHLEKIWEQKQILLKKRSIEKKSMDHLREKQAREYGQMVLKAEQKELDEISALKTARGVSHDTE